MLAYTAETDHGRFLVKLEGSLTEEAAPVLERLAQELQGRKAVAFDSEKLARISSVGVRLWLSVVNSLPASAQIEYHNCSTFFIDYVNLLPAFLGGGRVVSFYMPYRCSRCRSSVLIHVFSAEALRTRGNHTYRCSRCNHELDCETVVDDYLTFLLGA